MPKKELTPAEKEQERKRKKAEQWQKVLLYYLNRMYHEEQEKELAKYKPEPSILSVMAGYIREKRLLAKLREKRNGELSGLELLERLERFQEEDSPFSTLLKDIRENSPEEKIEESINRVMLEAPQQIVNRGRRNANRKNQPGQAPREQPQPDPLDEERTRYEMAFLRTVMPPELYRKLWEELVKQGRMESEWAAPERPGPERERKGPTYAEYTAMHSVDPVEKDGKAENLDEIFTAAAYQLAAYEQKDTPEFDGKKADVRAMELSGSRAFRSFMNGHPGSLLAAARNTGLEATHREFVKQEKKLRTRDEILTAVRDGLKGQLRGRSAEYHQMTNALDRFVSAPVEPGSRERSTLALQLAQFVMTEGNPASPDYRRESSMLAAKALKALLSGKDFNTFLVQANLGRDPDRQLTLRELDAFVVPRERNALQQAGPEPERNRNDRQHRIPGG